MRRSPIKSTRTLLRQNLRLVKQLYPGIPRRNLAVLRDLTRTYGISLSLGEIMSFDGKWHVTHAGLLRIAARRRCRGIHTMLQHRLCDPTAGRWVFRATVYKGNGSKGFVGYGDADPSNTSFAVRGSEMRVAETRAVNRALRKAYGIGLCSVEELGWLTGSSSPTKEQAPLVKSSPQNGSNNGQPKLRDQLCVLIRQYNLDPMLVKAYAADFCGTPSLKEASRELVESFISHLASSAQENRDALICKLNSYAQPAEARP